jgi:hypothetical protein
MHYGHMISLCTKHARHVFLSPDVRRIGERKWTVKICRCFVTARIVSHRLCRDYRDEPLTVTDRRICELKCPFVTV